MQKQFRAIARSLKTRMQYYRRVLRHPRTPRLSRILLWAALAYAISPIDIVPDFIPVLGQLDDLVIVPALVLAALWMVPEEVRRDCE